MLSVTVAIARAVAVDAEVGAGHAGGGAPGDLVAEQPPAQEHALAGGGGDQPAVEVLELDLFPGDDPGPVGPAVAVDVTPASATATTAATAIGRRNQLDADVI